MSVKPRVHITGGCGYVGSRVATSLAARGYSLVVIDKATPEERHITLPAGTEFRQVDLTEQRKATEALHDAEYVIHFAANIGSMDYMWNHQAEIMWENSAIDAAVYPAFQKAGTKLVLYSSTSMIFQHAPRYPYVETDLAETPAPTNVYGFSKYAGEYFCRSYKQQYGGPDYVIVRFHNIYGPGEDSKGSTPGDIHVLPALIEKVLRGQYPLEIIGSPEATRPMTYIDDTVDAVVLLFETALERKKNVLNTDFNISVSEATKIADLGEKIWKLLGDGRPYKYVLTGETDASKTTALRREANPSKLVSAVGWQPKMTLDEGILKTAEWVKEVIARG